MEGVRVEEVEPDEFVRRVECLTRVKMFNYFWFNSTIL